MVLLILKCHMPHALVNDVSKETCANTNWQSLRYPQTFRGVLCWSSLVRSMDIFKVKLRPCLN